jgi:HlyD family secretion protein
MGIEVPVMLREAPAVVEREAPVEAAGMSRPAPPVRSHHDVSPTPRRRARVIGTVVVLATLAGGIWWFLKGRGVDSPVFRFASIERGDLRSTVSATGALSAIKTVLVGTQVSGQVAEIHADFNDPVKKGQLLARLDPTFQRQAVQDADANRNKATAQLLQAQQEFDRSKALQASQVITASELGTAQLNLSVAQAGVRSAQVALDKAQQNLSLTNIYSPIDGIVVERDVDVGQTVAASLSAPQLFLLADDLTHMQILAAVDESDIGNIKDGQTALFTVQTYPGRTFTGNVSQVRLQSKTTDNVVSYIVVVLLDNVDRKLLPGMTATVEFVTGSVTDALLVPNAALRFRPTADLLVAAGLPTTTTTNAARPTRPTDSTAGSTAAPGVAPGPASNRAGRLGSGVGGSGVLWTLGANQKVKPVHVRIGLTDGQRTQVTGDSLVAGMQVIVGSTTAGSTVAPVTPAANPLTPQPTRRGPGGP